MDVGTELADILTFFDKEHCGKEFQSYERPTPRVHVDRAARFNYEIKHSSGGSFCGMNLNKQYATDAIEDARMFIVFELLDVLGALPEEDWA
jgi:hypothetical protein